MNKSQLYFKTTFTPSVTEVILKHTFLFSSEWTQSLKSLHRKLIIITDDHVKKEVADRFVIHLLAEGVDVHLLSIGAGEESKSRQTKEHLENEMLELKCGRDCLVIGMGGGVVTDLAGFLASTYCRGVPVILIPTTLLGMVDAAIGGKTAVNTPYGKNLVGTFYPPLKVLIDTSLLSSLPEKEWKNGLAEIVKYGLIQSPSLLNKLLHHHLKWQKRDQIFLEEIIYESVCIKQAVIEIDFQEGGLRRILNFGHTVAHAIEVLENYHISHGEAVAIGMLVESKLSQLLGYLSTEEFTEIEKIIHLFSFPLKLSHRCNAHQLVEAMALDKKSKGQKPRFVILNKIGEIVPFEGAYCTTIDGTVLNQLLHWMTTHIEGA